MLDEPKIWALYVLAFLGAAFWSLGSPALRSLTPRLVPDDQLAAASALNQRYSNLGAVAGPALGGLLIATLGLTTTYLIDFATFAASLVAIALLPTIPPAVDAGKAGLRSFLEGLRSVVSGRIACVLGTLALVATIPALLRYQAPEREAD